MTLLVDNATADINVESKKRALLHNLYYFSGYTLECIINYSILKHYRWKASDSVYTTNYNFSNSCDVSFFGDTRSLDGKRTYRYSFHGHNFQDNINVLKRNFSASKIPMIDRSIKVDSDLVKLFNYWRPDLRYNPENTADSLVLLSENKVRDFVTLTETIYNSLMHTIG